ncbi:MAG: 6-bladed beta-propeller, partial [Balneolaceae bacterium]|nr:6-bladed beta-propeller [Balneolaceae bacterium]
MKIKILSFLIIITMGCVFEEKTKTPDQFQELQNLTVYSTNTKPSKTISFKKDAVYGDSDTVLIGSLRDVVVDSLGRVFIADSQKQVIYLFEPDGRLVDQLGREGKGPGEFGSIKSLQIRNDHLYVFDPNQYKVIVFSLETLTVDKTIILAKNRKEYQDLNRAFPLI